MRNNKVKTIKPRLSLNTVPLLSELSELIGGPGLRRWRTGPGGPGTETDKILIDKCLGPTTDPWGTPEKNTCVHSCKFHNQSLSNQLKLHNCMNSTWYR